MSLLTASECRNDHVRCIAIPHYHCGLLPHEKMSFVVVYIDMRSGMHEATYHNTKLGFANAQYLLQVHMYRRRFFFVVCVPMLLLDLGIINSVNREISIYFTGQTDDRQT